MHAVKHIGGYDRTPECRYIHPQTPGQTWISKARVHEVNHEATTALMNLLDTKGIGPKANKVNSRLVLYRLEDIRTTDFRKLVKNNPKLTAALGTDTPTMKTDVPVSDEKLIAAIRVINDLVQSGKISVTQKTDGTLRVLKTVEIG